MIVLYISHVFLGAQGLSFFLCKMRLVPVVCMDECYERGKGGDDLSGLKSHTVKLNFWYLWEDRPKLDAVAGTLLNERVFGVFGVGGSGLRGLCDGRRLPKMVSSQGLHASPTKTLPLKNET